MEARGEGWREEVGNRRSRRGLSNDENEVKDKKQCGREGTGGKEGQEWLEHEVERDGRKEG